MLPSDIEYRTAAFFAPRTRKVKAHGGFQWTVQVRSARRSGLKKRRPTPPSGSSDCSLKVDAGISTLVPVLGITNLCHSSASAGVANVARLKIRGAEKRNICIGTSR